MGKKTEKQKMSSTLRKKAEERLRKLSTKPLQELSAEDSQYLIHELRVHQIELEMQNQELRDAQESLEDSRSRYCDLYDFAPTGYFTISEKGMILEVNLTGAEQLGIGRSSLIKKPFSRFIHKDDADIFYLHSHEIMKSEKRRTCQIRLKRKDKTEFYAHLESIAVNDSNGNYNHMRTAVINITERVQAEKIIKQSEENYERLLESISDGIAILDRNWQYVLVNKALMQMTGKSKEDLLGSKIMDVFPDVEDTKFFKTYRKVMRTGKSNVIHDSYVFEDGREGYYEAHVYPVPEGIFIIASDITVRKRAEDELKIRQQLNKRLLDSLPHPAMLINKDRKILAANRIAREVGAKEGGYCWQDFGHGEYIPDEDKKYIDKHKKTPECGTRCYFCKADEALQDHASENIEVDAFNKQWDTYWVPLEEDTYLHYAIDITDRKRAEEELEKHRNHLKEMVEERTKELKETYMELNKEVTEKLNYQAEAVRSAELASIGELAAGVAHEINNPVNGIINCAQILANKYEPESKDHKVANIIIKEGDRIASIVSSLLSLSRTNDNKKSPVRINEIMGDIISLTGAQLRKDGITLKVDIPMDLPLLNANYNQLEQVFLNILTNARYAINEKYPDYNENKIIKIKGEKAAVGSRTIFRLTFFDSGVGIPYNILNKIMNPFFTTKPANQGTGLGLSISHGILNDHGGTINIDSIFGQFTKVTIDLPVNK
jgi:PAS domain S-box-containing protein